MVSSAQVTGGKIEKLRELYNLEKYEDCMFKADRLSQSDKHSKDPEPYLYMSMSMYKISLQDNEELKEAYKDPIADAIKFALKYKMKDKKLELYEANKSYFITLKQAAVNQASTPLRSSEYRKASSIYGNILKLEDDPAIKFIKGFCEIKLRNPAMGNKLVTEALNYYEKAVLTDSLFYKKIDAGSKEALIDGSLLFCNYLTDQNLADSAKKVALIAHKLLPQEEVVTNKYNKLWDIKDDSKPRVKNGMLVNYKTSISDTDSINKLKSINSTSDPLKNESDSLRAPDPNKNP